MHGIPGLGFLVLLGDALTGDCFLVATGDTAFLRLGGVAILSLLLAALLSAVSLSSSSLSMLLLSVVASSLLLSLHSTQGHIHCIAPHVRQRV
jgi:hypothetical protein